MNPQTENSRSCGEFRERILRKKNTLAQGTATVTITAALAGITQQAKGALIVHNYGFTNSDGDVDPVQGIAATSLPFGPDIFTWFSSGGLVFGSPGNGSIAVQLSMVNSEIGPSTSFQPLGRLTNIDFNDISQINRNFIGFQLQNQGAGNNETWYGYFEFSVRDNGIFDPNVILHRSLIDDTGNPIQIPEPSSTILGGIALFVAILFRKRR